MAEETYDYDVRCRTCRTKFKAQLFDSHEKNLYIVDNKHWYCEKCKKEYFNKQAAELAKAHQAVGFPELQGSQKQVSWAEKVRAEMINKVDYLRKSLKFDNDDERKLSEKAFEGFLKEWQEKTEAKWWIDQRRMTVRGIAKRVGEISESMKNE
jgi:hypothetical protein